MSLLELIPLGRANAKTAQELADATGWTYRDITSEGHRLRTEGHLIMSENNQFVKGYYLSNDLMDVVRFITSMESRRTQIAKAVAGAKAYLDLHNG